MPDTDTDNPIQSKNVGIMRRDLLRLLDYLDHGDLECKGAGRAVVLLFGTCSMAYLHNLDKPKLLALFAKMLDGFDPTEELPKEGDSVQ